MFIFQVLRQLAALKSSVSAQERTALQALQTSSLESSSLPLGDLQQDVPQLLALPCTAAAPAHVLSDCILVDSDEETHADVICRLDQGSDPLLSAFVVFKVAHVRPGRLKRPLMAEDAIGPNDMALRRYDVLERDMSDPNSSAFGWHVCRALKCSYSPNTKDVFI